MSNLIPSISEEELSLHQFFLLVLLRDDTKSFTMSQIASATRHTTAAATGAVDRLEEKGWVKRQSSKEDRRVILVKITNKGLGLIDRVQANRANFVESLISKLTPKEKATCMTIHEKILEFRSQEAPIFQCIKNS